MKWHYIGFFFLPLSSLLPIHRKTLVGRLIQVASDGRWPTRSNIFSTKQSGFITEQPPKIFPQNSILLNHILYEQLVKCNTHVHAYHLYLFPKHGKATFIRQSTCVPKHFLFRSATFQLHFRYAVQSSCPKHDTRTKIILHI